MIILDDLFFREVAKLIKIWNNLKIILWQVKKKNQDFETPCIKSSE